MYSSLFVILHCTTHGLVFTHAHHNEKTAAADGLILNACTSGKIGCAMAARKGKLKIYSLKTAQGR